MRLWFLLGLLVLLPVVALAVEGKKAVSDKKEAPALKMPEAPAPLLPLPMPQKLGDPTTPIANHMKAAKEYFKAKRLLEEHTALYQATNRKLLEEYIATRPCVPRTVLDRYKEIGRFPAETFEKHYLARLITRLTEKDLLALTEFYQSHVGKFFNEWRMKNNGVSTTVVPVEDKLDKEVYAMYQDYVVKEHLALLELSQKGDLLPAKEQNANEELIMGSMAMLVQPYLDPQGNCPQ